MRSLEDAARLYRSKSRKANFIICQLCYWCASCLKADNDFPRCKCCRNQIVDALPISDEEFYKQDSRIQPPVYQMASLNE
jgi:hypothetical protein